MSDPEIIVDDPAVLANRAALQAAYVAEQQRLADMEAKRQQAKALYVKLKAGTATNAEVQRVLAFLLRYLAIQETD